MSKTFKPFADGTASMKIADLTMENQGDRLSIYGSIDITADKPGLARAKVLAGILADAVTALEASDLPDAVEINPLTEGENPFGV